MNSRARLVQVSLALLIALLAWLLLGCGPRLSDGQAQALSEARAGAQALQEKQHALTLETDPAAAAELVRALLDDLGRGAAGFTLAATANLDLPAPTFQPAVLREQPVEATRYREAGKLAAMSPPEGWSWEAWVGIGTAGFAAVGGLLRLGRNIPGVGGIAASVLGGLWDHLAPTKVKEQEQAADRGLDVAVQYGDYLATALKRAGLGELVESAKNRAWMVASRVGARDLIDERLDQVRAKPHPELSPATLPEQIVPPG